MASPYQWVEASSRTREAVMRKSSIAGIVVVSFIAVSVPGRAEEDAETGLEAASVYDHENLAVVALHKKGATSAPQGDFLTFDEASDKDVVEVTELEADEADQGSAQQQQPARQNANAGSGAQVQKVEVSNTSDNPIFLMAGEVVLGGKQDRVISNNTIVPPGAQDLEVDVFCVERGRWGGNEKSFKSSGKMGHSELRRKAQNESQKAVWDEVAETNEKQQAKSKTQSFRASLEKAEGDRDISGYVQAILPKLKADKKAVGIAVAVDGEMVAVDAFANPKIFGHVRKKLLESYALEAASSEDKRTDEDVEKADAEIFLNEAAKAKRTGSEKQGDAKNYTFESDTVQGSRTESDEGTIHQFYRAY